MIYIKLSTLEFPRHEGDIRLEHPEIPENLTGDSFPCPNTYAKVIAEPFPIIDDTKQSYVYDVPKNENGTWTVGYVIINYSPEEIARIAEMKAKANPLKKPGKAPNVVT